MPAHVEAIHLAERSGGEPFPVEQVKVIPGLGLEGDRLVNEAKPGEPNAPFRHVTLIEIEALEAIRREKDIELSPAHSRRNICTRGVALNHLVDREFTVGEVRLRGIELCEPCGTLEKLTGHKGLITALLHRGGLRAQIVGSGTIRVGDPIRS